MSASDNTICIKCTFKNSVYCKVIEEHRDWLAWDPFKCHKLFFIRSIFRSLNHTFTFEEVDQVNEYFEGNFDDDHYCADFISDWYWHNHGQKSFVRDKIQEYADKHGLTAIICPDVPDDDDESDSSFIADSEDDLSDPDYKTSSDDSDVDG